MVLFEYPLNERIRSLLRLEYLFRRLFLLSKSLEPALQHVALSVLFEIVDICDRAEVRTGILQDIDKQKISLESYRAVPEVDQKALDKVLADLDRVSDALAASGRIGQSTRDDSWLVNLKNRFASSGTAAPIDMPQYCVWQHRPEQERQECLKTWIKPFLPLYEALAQLLKNLRESGITRQIRTQNGGSYQETLGGQCYQMVRIWVESGTNVYPEIIANKHVVSIHFRLLGQDMSSKLMTQNISFNMALCNV